MTTSINYGGVDDVFATMQRGSGDIRAALDLVQATATRTLASWTGTAREAYTVAERQWNAAASDMHTSLTRMAALLPQITDGYRGTDRMVANNFQGGAAR